MRRQKEVIASISLALLVCQLLLVVDTEANDRPPIVKTAFEIQAQDFRFNLSEESRKRVEMEVAKNLASLGNEWFPFVEWKPMDESDNPGDIAYLLRLTLEGEDNSEFAQDIYLAYSASIMGKPKKLLKTPRKQLYKYSDDQPTQYRNKLRRALSKTIAAQFSNAEFQEGLERYFLAHIPLATELRLDAPNKLFSIPITWQGLELGKESVFSVIFTAEVPDESTTSDIVLVDDGIIELNPHRDMIGKLGCVAILFAHHAKTYAKNEIIGDPDVWNYITEVFDALVDGSLRVFMKDFSLPEGGFDSVVIDPGE
jgi:hypothetical protein